MAGRRKNENFEKLNFKLVKRGNKYQAQCSVCGLNIKNTAAARLQSHRNVCLPRDIQQSKSLSENLSKISNTDEMTENVDNGTQSETWLDMQVSEDGSLVPIVATQDTSSCTSSNVSNTPRTSRATLDSFVISHSSTTPKATDVASLQNSTPMQLAKKSKITHFIDKLSVKEESELNEALAEFFFGCNIPFNTVESRHFKNFIKKLRPAYVNKLPARKSLSMGLLDKTYEKCLVKARDSLHNESVLLIDGWKNSSNNSKTVVCMLHTANGNQAFLNAWDLTGDSETGEKLSDLIHESIELARNMYSTSIYAVVSDNASAMIKMGKLVSHVIWHSTCSSHTANLLAKDVLDKNCTEKVITILKEFKQADLEKKIVDRGGERIKLPCDTRWCSYRNSYTCLIKNLPYMKLIVADESCKKIKHNITSLIFNDEFIQIVSDNIELFNPICELINVCQSSDCSIADAANLWITLKVPNKYEDKFKERIEARKNMALNIYALTAYYLHPHYDNDKLNKAEKDKINLFLLKNLDAQGIEEWDSFRIKDGLFKVLYLKNIEKPMVFWRTAEMNFPKLAELALKLLNIPASSAQLERIFSNWAYIHSPIRNRLTFEKSKKLMHVYYSLRLLDETSDSDDDLIDLTN